MKCLLLERGQRVHNKKKRTNKHTGRPNKRIYRLHSFQRLPVCNLCWKEKKSHSFKTNVFKSKGSSSADGNKHSLPVLGCAAAAPGSVSSGRHCGLYPAVNSGTGALPQSHAEAHLCSTHPTLRPAIPQGEGCGENSESGRNQAAGSNSVALPITLSGL